MPKLTDYWQYTASNIKKTFIPIQNAMVPQHNLANFKYQHRLALISGSLEEVKRTGSNYYAIIYISVAILSVCDI